MNGKMLSVFRGFFMGVSEALMVSCYLSGSSVQRSSTKGRESSALPWVRHPERPATVSVSCLSSLMTQFDVSAFISEPVSHHCG